MLASCCTCHLTATLALLLTCACAAAVLAGKEDHYGGIIVDDSALPRDPQSFQAALQQSLEVCWRSVRATSMASCSMPHMSCVHLEHSCAAVSPKRTLQVLSPFAPPYDMI